MSPSFINVGYPNSGHGNVSRTRYDAFPAIEILSTQLIGNVILKGVYGVLLLIMLIRLSNIITVLNAGSEVSVAHGNDVGWRSARFNEKKKIVNVES